MHNSQYIYFDWNAIKEAQARYSEDKVFQTLDWLNSQEFYFPFSFAQLCDRQRGESELIRQDLEFLKSFSNDYMIDVSPDTKEYKISRQDVFEKYKEVKDSKSYYPMVTLDENEKLEIKQNDLESYLKTYPDRLRRVFLNGFDRFNNNPEMYKEIRTLMHEKGNSYEDPDDPVSFIIKHDLSAENINLLIELFKKDDTDITLKNILQNIYLVLDNKYSYLEESIKEKVNYKNSFSNIYNDSMHMIIGMHAKCFVTNDKMVERKSKIIYNALGITTKILSFGEFLDYAKNL